MAFGLSNHTVDILRPGTSTGLSGEINEAYAVHIAGLGCRLQRRKSTETIYTGKETFMSDAVLYCNPNEDIKEADRVNDNGQEYEVKGVDPDHDNMNVYMRVDLLKIG